MSHTHRSFSAEITAKPECWLLGGVKVLRSSRFQTEEQAKDFAWAIHSTQSANVATVTINVSARRPEILASQTGHSL